MPFLRRFNTRIIANIGGETVEEYVEIAERLNGVKGLDGLEVNVSCPNIKRGGNSQRRGGFKNREAFQ